MTEVCLKKKRLDLKLHTQCAKSWKSQDNGQSCLWTPR